MARTHASGPNTDRHDHGILDPNASALFERRRLAMNDGAEQLADAHTVRPLWAPSES